MALVKMERALADSIVEKPLRQAETPDRCPTDEARNPEYFDVGLEGFNVGNKSSSLPA